MPPTITIPTTAIAYPPNGKPYTTYTLTLRSPSQLRPTQIPKRYSDFEGLHTALTSSTGKAPPTPLPAKSWFFARSTVNNDALTESRRQGLEAYLHAIQTDSDPRWRDSDVFQAFISPDDGGEKDGKRQHGVAATTGRRSAAAGGDNYISTGSAWLDVHAELKTQLHDARMALARREQASTPKAEHEAGAAAKKALVKSGTAIARLEDGLRRMSGKGNASSDGEVERLGDGEVRRRRDMLAAARKEREGLESVLNTLAVKSAVAGLNPGSVGSGPGATAGAKGALFQQTPQPSGGGGGRRVLGGPPAKETERTRELDNEGVLQLQKQIMQEQDLDVEDLTMAIRRMKDLGIKINEELVEQSTLLDMVDQDVDRVGSKIEIATKRIKKIN